MMHIFSFVNPHEKGQRGNHYKFTLLANEDSESEFAGIKIELHQSMITH